MPDYQYVAWFRDHTMRPGDQDHEWCACFVVVTTNGDDAVTWGDRLASDYSRRRGDCEFLRSYLDTDLWHDTRVPRVVAGESAPDEVIGW